MSSQKLPADATGVTIAVLVFALTLSTIAIFWQAQVIARQQAVIHMQEEQQ